MDYRPWELKEPRAPSCLSFGAESSDSGGRQMQQGDGRGVLARGDPRSFLSVDIQPRLSACYALWIMPGAEDTKMNKAIVLPQSVKENRLVNRRIIAQRIRAIKKIGSEGAEQRQWRSASGNQEGGQPRNSHSHSALLCWASAGGEPLQTVSVGFCGFCPWEAMVSDWRKDREKSAYLSCFFSALNCYLQNLQSSWVSTMTSSLAGQAPGCGFSGQLWPLGSGNLLHLPSSLEGVAASCWCWSLVCLGVSWLVAQFSHHLWNQPPTINSQYLNTGSSNTVFLGGLWWIPPKGADRWAGC